MMMNHQQKTIITTTTDDEALSIRRQRFYPMPPIFDERPW
jgi:hypothetical protein